MKFKTTNSPDNIAVEGQDLVIKFCFAKQTEENLYKNMTYWSECRDFMGDAICGMQDGKVKHIYGFKYNPETHPLDTEKTVIGIRFPNKEIRDEFQKNSLIYLDDFLIPFEQPLLYTVEKMVGSPNTLVLTFDKFWQQTTFNISLLTFVLKGLCWELNQDLPLFDAIEQTKKNEYPTKEARYLDKNVKDRLLKVLKNLVELTNKHKYPHGYDKDTPINTVHNRSGFNFNCRWLDQETVISKWLKEQQNEQL